MNPFRSCCRRRINKETASHTQAVHTQKTCSLSLYLSIWRLEKKKKKKKPRGETGGSISGSDSNLTTTHKTYKYREEISLSAPMLCIGRKEMLGVGWGGKSRGICLYLSFHLFLSILPAFLAPALFDYYVDVDVLPFGPTDDGDIDEEDQGSILMELISSDRRLAGGGL